jgi:hypothetical protein
MPEKERNPVHDEFFNHFKELQNDMLNIQQLIKGREKSGAAFDTISNELESLKEDGLERILSMKNLHKKNRNLFPNNTTELLNHSMKLINEVHPEILSQEKWAFNEKWLSEFKKSFGY